MRGSFLAVAVVQIAVLSGLVIGTTVWAAPLSKKPAPKKDPKWVHVGFGLITQNLMSKFSTDKTGSSNKYGTSYLGVQLTYRLGGANFIFIPTLSLTPLGLADEDSSAKRRIYTLGLPVGIRGWLGELRVGPGLYFYEIAGTAGEVTLNNGNSTQTFYAPSGSGTTMQFAAIAGLGREINENFRIDLDVLATNVAGSNRSITTQLYLSYGVY